MNKIVKYLGYFCIYLIALFNGYLISLMIMAMLSSAVCTVWSFITVLPAFIAESYGKILLLSAVPLGIGLSIYIMYQTRPRSKQDKKQGNGNQ